MDDFLKQGLQNAKKKFLKETFDCLLNIEKKKTFIVESTFPTIDKIEISIQKIRRCFKFKTTPLNHVKEFASYKNDGYGFMKSITLKNNNVYWTVPKGVAKMTLNLGDNVLVEGEIWQIENSFTTKDRKYFRLLIPKEYNPNKNHSSFIHSENFAVGESLHFGGLTEFKCNGNDYHLFEYHKGKRYYLLIDSMSPMLYEEFEKSIGAISYSLGLITGYIPRDEMYIFQSENNDFKGITGFHFRKIENTISSGMEIVSPDVLFEIVKSKYEKGQITEQERTSLLEKGYITKDVLSNMTTKARQDNRFLRALKIISEGNEYPLEIRASAYSVALETIKNIIIEENEDKINPFKEKKFARAISKKLKEIIIPLDDIHFNNKDAILNKLDLINQVTNKDSFKIAFSLCKFKLNESDEEALQKRNDFLHGRIPFETEAETIQNKELKFITYKLHFLVTVLIMKHSKFNGFIKNNPKFFSVFAEDNKEIDEPLFRHT